MTTQKPWQFPLLAIAVSSRGSAFVAMPTPFQIEARASSRKPWPGRVDRVLSWFQPRTILVAHGARWHVTRSLRDVAQALPNTEQFEPISLNHVCDVLGCAPTLAGVAERVMDMYPETEPRFANFLTSPRRTDRTRRARPLLSAYALAHAASFAHLVKFG